MSSYSDYAEAVGRLMQQQGDISARAELAKGAALSQAQANNAATWGNTIGNLGQIPGHVIAQQAQTKELQLREQEQQLRNQALQGQVKAQELQRLTSQQANQIVATFPRNPDNTYNVVGIQGKLAQIGIPLEQQKGVLDVIEGMNGIATSFNKSKIDHAADAAQLLISQHPAGQPWAWADVQLSAAGLKPTGLVSDEDQKLIDQAAESGANPEAFLKAMRDKSPKYKDVEKDAAALRKATADATVAEQVAAGTKGGLTPEQQATDRRATAAAQTTETNRLATEDRLAKAQQETARHNLAMEKRPVAGAGGAGQPDNVALAVQAMKEGTAPPLLPGRASKEYVAMIAEAKRQNYDLASAATDWMATQKHIATLNGAQQTRLNQAIGQLPELLDSIDDLASQWKAGRFPPLNKAKLALAKNGALGQQAASIARQLDAQIADVTADLGTVYMGGNSPTDTGLELSGKALASDWDEKTLHDMVALARKNVTIRQNSIRNTGVQGASANNPYVPQAAPAAGDRVRVVGPKGETGTMPKGTALPTGWKVAGP